MLVIVALWLIKAAVCPVHFAVFVYIAPVVGIYHTRFLGYLSLAYIALAVCIHRTNLLLISFAIDRWVLPMKPVWVMNS